MTETARGGIAPAPVLLRHYSPNNCFFYEYDPAVGDPDNGVAPGTPWDQVPDSWVCPICGMGKDVFEKA